MKVFDNYSVSMDEIIEYIKNDHSREFVRLYQQIITQEHWLKLQEYQEYEFKIIYDNCVFDNCTFNTPFHCHWLGQNQYVHCAFRRCSFCGITVKYFEHTYFDACIFNDVRLVDLYHCHFENRTTFLNSEFKHIIRCGFYSCIIKDGKFNEVSFIHCEIIEETSFLTNDEPSNLDEFVPLGCPSSGSFIGWKKVLGVDEHYYIIKLMIPEDAKRTSSFGPKCRCDKARVEEIKCYGTEEEVKSVISLGIFDHNIKTEYTVGSYVYPDSYDDNRLIECTHGIHFFIDKKLAEHYI